MMEQIRWPDLPRLPEPFRSAVANSGSGPIHIRAVRVAHEQGDPDMFNAIWEYLHERWHLDPWAFAQAFAQAYPQKSGAILIVYRTHVTKGYKSRPTSERYYTIAGGRARKRPLRKRPALPLLAIIDITGVQLARTDTPSIFLPGIRHLEVA